MRSHEEFGRYLQEARRQKALTQREVSSRLNYSSAQFISNFERGLALPPVGKLKKLIGMYGLDTKAVIELLIEDHRRRLRRGLTGR